MKKNLTEIIYVLDRSGSMGHLTIDTIGAYNAYLDRQKDFEGETKITTVLFDDEYELLFDGVNLDEAQLNKDNYFVRGSTALYDALGKTILDVGNRLSHTAEEERPEKVIFIVITDGYENASREFSQFQVREMIEHQQNKYSWEFMFFGANIDSVSTASCIGISADRAVNFEATSNGVDVMMCCCAEMTKSIRDDE